VVKMNAGHYRTVDKDDKGAGLRLLLIAAARCNLHRGGIPDNGLPLENLRLPNITSLH
jgi:hypothetical protein